MVRRCRVAARAWGRLRLGVEPAASGYRSSFSQVRLEQFGASGNLLL